MRSALGRRHVEVIRAVARGLFDKEIALELGISQQTVKNYLLDIYAALGVNGRLGALAKLGWIVVPESGPDWTGAERGQVVHIAPVVPTERDEAMFAVARSGATAYTEIDQTLRLPRNTVYGRFALLAKYGTLPEDIAVWRGQRRQGNRGRSPDARVAAVEEVRPAPLTAETFEERRRQAAKAAADRVWQARHGATITP